MDSLELVKSIVRAMDAKQAEEIHVIRVDDLTIIADYFIIAHGTNTTQVKAIADEVEIKVGEQGRKPLKVEGYQNASWIVLDYGDVIAHVFYGETREYYKLERLWADGEQLEIDTLLN